jgi:hypothetical protein
MIVQKNRASCMALLRSASRPPYFPRSAGARLHMAKVVWHLLNRWKQVIIAAQKFDGHPQQINWYFFDIFCGFLL